MREHRPNSFPATVRILAVLGTLLLLGYGLAELAIGYTYIPVRRAGFLLLSGTATLMIAVGVLLLGAACLLVVADHYDRRDNEAHYVATRGFLAKAGLLLLLMAPVSEIVFALLRASTGIEVPDYRGFARDATWHSPELARHAPRLDDMVDLEFALVMLAISVSALLASLACNRWGGALVKRIGMAFSGFAMIGFAVLLGASVLSDFVAGSVTASGAREITAAAEPAKFNAAMLTGSLASGMLLLAGIAGIAVSFKRQE